MTPTTTMDTLIAAASKVMEFMGTVVTALVDNPILAFFFAIPVIGAVLVLFKKFRRTAK